MKGLERMNNFDLRNKYINKLCEEIENIEANDIGIFCEEFLMVECCKNDYAMKYVYKALESVENKQQYAINGMERYSTYRMFSSAIDKQIEIINMISLFQYCEENNNYNIIDNLIKKAFKKDYNDYCNQKFSYEDSFRNRIVYLFLSALHNLDISRWSREYKTFLSDGAIDVYESFYKYKPTAIELDNIKDADVIKKYNLYKGNKSLNEIEDESSEVIFERYLEDVLRESNLLLNETFKDIWIDENEELLVENFSKVRFKYLTKESAELTYIVSSIVEIMENSNTILHHKLSKNDILYAVNMGFILAKKNNLDINKDSILVLIPLLIKLFSDKLNEYNKQCIISCNDKLKTEVMMYELNKAHEKEINEIKADNMTLAERNKSLENRIAELERENNLLKAKINKNLDKNKKENKDKKELESLRNLFFSLEHEEIETSEFIEDKNIKDIDEKKIAFIGSNDILHSRLKNRFKNFTYITADEETRDLSFIRNMNHIFLHTHSPHSLYYKVLELIKPYNIGLTFINSTNVDIISNIVIEELNKKEAI